MSEPQSRGRAAAIRLQALADQMLAEVQPLSADSITWQPAAGVWSVMDILCHVEEFIPYWTAQLSGIVRHPQRAWGRDHTDKARLAAVQRTALRRLPDVEQGIRRAVRESAQVLAGLRDAEFAIEAPSRNPRWGVKPAQFVLDHLLVQHVEKHIGQIRRNVSQRAKKDEPAS